MRSRKGFGAVAAAALLTGALSASAQDAWQLVWSDEFAGTAIDTTKWGWEVNATGGGNNELQFYTSRVQNSYVADGLLHIRAIKEPYTAIDPTDGQWKTRDYTSARLLSDGKGDWKYGRMEGRIKMPKGQGCWPAFWMLPTDWVYGGWASSGEIDIVEYRGDQPTNLYTTIHYGGTWPNNDANGGQTTVADMSEDFHVYAIEWEPTRFRWYFDGQLVYQTSDWWSANGDYPAPFDQRFHLMLNLAIGGNFLPDPPANADYFPQEMQVDYVRVYQLNPDEQTPWDGTVATIPGRIQAEYYDVGGDQVAYNDSTAENIGGAFRAEESVDIENAGDAGGGYSIGWFTAGEWIEYTVNVATSGAYNFKLRYASPNGNLAASIAMRQAGATVNELTGHMGPTGAWYTWNSADLGEMPLTAGTYILRITNANQDFNFNFLDVDLVAADLPGDLWILM